MASVVSVVAATALRRREMSFDRFMGGLMEYFVVIRVWEELARD